MVTTAPFCAVGFSLASPPTPRPAASVAVPAEPTALHLRRRENEDAAEAALLAVGLQCFLPMGHYCLGVALARLGHQHRAALAFETSLTMLPGLLNAHRWLAALYARPGGDMTRAQDHRRLAAELQKQRQARPQQ